MKNYYSARQQTDNPWTVSNSYQKEEGEVEEEEKEEIKAAFGTDSGVRWHTGLNTEEKSEHSRA